MCQNGTEYLMILWGQKLIQKLGNFIHKFLNKFKNRVQIGHRNESYKDTTDKNKANKRYLFEQELVILVKIIESIYHSD